MSILELKDISVVMDDYDVFLFDLWGVVVEGNYLYPGVVNSINEVIEKKKVFFVSNAPRSTSSLFNTVKSWGINTTIDKVISSGQVAVDTILSSKERFSIEKPVVYRLGSEENDIVKSLNCQVTGDIKEANILLFTVYRDEGPELDLNEFDDILKIAVERKMINICANPDIGIMQRGTYRYCAGYYAQKLKEFGGEVLYVGKPHREIYDKVLNQLDNIPKDRILMIGDTFYTDILGANDVGIDSALVLTGNAEKFHVDYSKIEDKLIHIRIAAAEQGVMPTFVIKLGLAPV